ncbi:MAG: AbrB/MazE/SpoVT family DNA-binding domain-containing protein [Candidatus Heimdallarchaeota archaeon]
MSDASDISERGYIRKRFTVVIPARIRRKLQLKENEPIEITLQGDRIILTAIREDPFEKLTRYGTGVVYNRNAKLDAETALQALPRSQEVDVD